MGLTNAFNELLSCVLTGLSTSIFILLGVRFGLLPILYLSPNPMPEEKDEEDDS